MKWKIHFWWWSSRFCALWGGARASGRRARYREYLETDSIISEHGATWVRHLPPWCWHRWAFNVGRNPTRGVPCQDAHNLQVRSLDTRTKNRHVAQNDVGRYTHSNLHAIQRNPVCNSWSCHLPRNRCITRSQRWECVYRWEAEVPAGVPRSATLGLYAPADAAVSVEYCGSWSETAEGQPLRHCALRASGRASKIDWQLS